jgi:glycosyltransferase involved in cell wall biosynthesis
LDQSHQTILQIIPRLDAGGAERSTVDIAAALVSAGYRAIVVSEGGRLEPELNVIGASSIRLQAASKNPLTILRNAESLSRIVRQHDVSLIHARSRAPAWSGYLAALHNHIPFVTTHHGTYGAKTAAKRLYNSVMVRGDAVIANSQWTADHLSKVHSVTPKRVEIIPRGIDLKLFDPERVTGDQIKSLRENWLTPDGARIILLPGRLTRWKGQLVLIDALAYLARQGG